MSQSDINQTDVDANEATSWVYKMSKELLQSRLRDFGQSDAGTVTEVRQRMVTLLNRIRKLSEAKTVEPQVVKSTPTLTILQPTPNMCDVVRKWNVHFDGRDPVDFLERVTELCNAYRIQEDQLLGALIVLLRGAPLLWWRNNRDNWTSWQDFVREFRKFYISADYSLWLEQEISNRRQRPGERGKDFIIEIQTLIRRHGGLSEEQKLFRIYNNLLPEYRQYIRRRDVVDMDTLIQEIDEYERLQIELRTVRPSRTINIVSTLDQRELRSVRPPRTMNTVSALDRRVQVTDNTVDCGRCGELDHMHSKVGKNLEKLESVFRYNGAEQPIQTSPKAAVTSTSGTAVATVSVIETPTTKLPKSTEGVAPVSYMSVRQTSSPTVTLTEPARATETLRQRVLSPPTPLALKSNVVDVITNLKPLPTTFAVHANSRPSPTPQPVERKRVNVESTSAVATSSIQKASVDSKSSARWSYPMHHTRSKIPRPDGGVTWRAVTDPTAPQSPRRRYRKRRRHTWLPV